MPNCCGENGCPTELKMCCRANPKVSIKLKLGRGVWMFVNETTWLPAARIWVNPATIE